MLDMEHHDQGRGQEYQFSLKAYNGAGHYSVTTSEMFKIKGQTSPTGGILYHVGKESETEIYFQHATDFLCASWIGFEGDVSIVLDQ